MNVSLKSHLSVYKLLVVPPILIVIIVTAVIVRTFINNLLLYYRGLRHIPQPLSKYNLYHLIFLNNAKETAKIINSSDTEVQLITGPLFSSSVFSSSPTFVRNLSILNVDSFDKIPLAKKVLEAITGPHSLLTTSGKDHTRLRRSIAPTFSYDKLVRQYAPIFKKKGYETAKRLYDNNGKDESIYMIRKGTFEVIMAVLFGDNFISQEISDHLLNLYQTSLSTPRLQAAVSLIFTALFPFIRIPDISKAGKSKEQLRKEVKQLCHSLISNAESMESISNSMLAVMYTCKLEGKFNEDELVDMVLTMLAAGQITTTVSFSWILVLLGKYKKYQQDLFDELSNYNDVEGDIEALDALPTLHSVVKECIRLYPPAMYNARIVTNPKGVTIDKYFLPANSVVRIPVLAMQTRKDVWGEDALDFNPYRYNRPEYKNNECQQWMSAVFWFGTHSCIGQKFAIIELKVFLAQVVMKYHISVDEDIVKKVDDIRSFNPLPHGLKVKLSKR